MEGKLFFQLSVSNLCIIISLKSIERLFLLVKREADLTLQNKSDIYKFKTVLEGIVEWQIHLDQYKALQYLMQSDNVNQEPACKKKKCCLDDTAVTFRVSCKASQVSSRHFSVKELSKDISGIIKRKTSWNVDLKNPIIEIVVHINRCGLVVGVPLCQKPLAERNYLKHTGLRSTIAWNLGSLADIQSGDTVLDPMCGCCILPIEAVKEWKEAHYMACDMSAKQVQKSSENLELSRESNRINVFQANVTDLPLKDQSVDKIICDLPFGNKHGEFEDMKTFYPKIINGMDRILKVGGTAVLLTSNKLQDFLITGCTVSLNDIITEDKKDKAKEEYSNINIKCDTAVIDNTANSDLCMRKCDNISLVEAKLEGQCSENKGHFKNVISNFFVNWSLKSHHYIKLGEMHSVACVFKKHSAHVPP